MKTRIDAFKAGILIGLAAVISARIDNKFLAALCFSTGLVSIRILKLSLFTGKIQLLRHRQLKVSELFLILAWNVAGVVIVSMLWRLVEPDTYGIWGTISAAKWSYEPWHYLFSGACCGILMTCATHEKTPLWVSSLCVVAFILAGFNHSIADAFYVSNEGVWKWLLVIVGNVLGGLAVAG